MEKQTIKTEREYEEILARIDSIFDADPDSPEGHELELLSLLVEKYEDEHYPIEDSNQSRQNPSPKDNGNPVQD